ncbi:MAG: hypothetical protein QOG09_1860, partial [Solirubrobacterales bacterium]|nr:hypothetical protein [Solirubrobacterales bacterium]
MVRRIEIGFVAGALGFLLLAARAQGADYSVVQCGWGVGLDAAWVGNSSHFRSASDCAGASPGVRSLTVANGHHAGSGAYARWRWSAPAGATITALRGSWWRSLAAGFRQRISGFDAGGRRAVLRESAASGASSALSAAPGGDFGHAIESELECRQKSCDQSPLSSAGVGRLIFTLRDSAAPVLTAGGPLASGGWLRGDQTVSFQASDQGSGVAAVDTLIDDHAQDHEDAPCRVAMVDGVRHGASMRPCDATRSGGSTIATAELTDGIHALKLCALDFSGERGCAPRIDAHIDNSAPSAPEALAVLDGDGWHSSNGFSL